MERDADPIPQAIAESRIIDTLALAATASVPSRSEPVEVMTYEIDPAANVIKLIWDDREYRVPFAVKTPEP